MARRVLIVDSDAAQRQGLAQTLVGAGFDACEAAGYEQGFAALASHSFDLVMIELMIPGGRGLQLARETRALYDAVEVIVVGGYSLSRGQLERAGLDPQAFVAKPYSCAELCRFIDMRLTRSCAGAPAGSAASAASAASHRC